MENASLIGLSRQTALRRQLDVIANNLANVNTPGFKAERMMFEEYLMPVANMEMARQRDGNMSYVQDLATIRDYAAGTLVQTENPLDVAIQGDGWFVVDTENGERYTRNGAFSTNALGELITQDGSRVLSTGGAITFGADEVDISIARDGTVSTNQGVKGQLRVVQFETNANLTPDGDSTFATDAEPQPVFSPVVAQGMIERANVEPVRELTHMIQVTRAYESLASQMRRSDDLRRDAIDALARVPN